MKEIPISQLPRECFENTAAMQLQGRIRLPASCEGRLSRCLRIFHHGAADPKTIQLNIDCQSLPNFLRLAAQRPHVHVTLGENVTGSYNFGFFGPGTVHVGKNTSSNGMEAMICENGVLKIGDDCMFAAHIMLHVGDNHAVFDMSTGEVINLRSSPYIHIEDHVWVGQRSSILGDVTVGRGSVIAAYSVLTKSPPPFSLAAGNPAVIRKNNISWTRAYKGDGRMDIIKHLQNIKEQVVRYTVRNTQALDYRQVIRDHASDFVSIAYHALLARAPDEAGHRAYIAELLKTGDYAGLLLSLKNSEEFLKNHTAITAQAKLDNPSLPPLVEKNLYKKVALFAEDFISSAYHGILEREPDESGKKSYTQNLARNGDLINLLLSLLKSEEFLQKSQAKQDEKNAENIGLIDYTQFIRNHASDFVTIAYHAMLRRAPDEAGHRVHIEKLSRTGDYAELLLAFKNSEEFLRRHIAFSTEPNSDKIQSPTLIEKNLYKKVAFFAEDFIFSAYQGILEREPDEFGKKSHTQNLLESGDLLSLLLALRNSEEFLKKFQAKQDEKNSKFLKSLLPPSSDKVVFCVVPSKTWLVTSLAVARFVFDTRGWKTIFLTDYNGDHESYFAGLKFCLGFLEFKNIKDIIHEKIKVDYICSHADNADEYIEALHHIFPQALLLCYADAFRNAAHGTLTFKKNMPSEVFYFGFPDFRKVGRVAAKSATLIPDVYYDAVDSYNASFFSPHEIEENYSIFFLRYWGMQGYQFKKEDVINSWTETVQHICKKGELIILKESNTYDRGLAEEFARILQSSGFRTEFLTDFANRYGFGFLAQSSYEHILKNGFMRKPRLLFTLDSSLPSMMLSFPYLHRSSRIVLGAAGHRYMSKYPAWSGVQNNLYQQTCSIEHNSTFAIRRFEKEPDLLLLESVRILDLCA